MANKKIDKRVCIRDIVYVSLAVMATGQIDTSDLPEILEHLKRAVFLTEREITSRAKAEEQVSS
jgi:hypothetical protein